VQRSDLEPNPNRKTADVLPLPYARSHEAASALADAFHDYPVMRFILADAGDVYDERLDALIGSYVRAKVLRRHPILGLEEQGLVVGVATLSPPGELEAMPEILSEREALWELLGPGGRARQEKLIEVWGRLEPSGPHYTLNMLGVRRAYAGTGYGRRLLDAVHDISSRDPASEGVILSTEDPKNVLLYEHFGYEVRSHERVAEDLETWILFRKND